MVDLHILPIGDLRYPAAFDSRPLSGRIEVAMQRYRGPLIRRTSRLLGFLSMDEVAQFQRICCWLALRDFDPGAGISFGAFLLIVIERQVASEIIAYMRHKRRFARAMMSLDAPLPGAEEGSDGDLASAHDLVPAPGRVEDFVLVDELLAGLRASMTDLEWAVFCDRADGYSMREIADRRSVKLKAVDNALVRVRKKILAATLDPSL